MKIVITGAKGQLGRELIKQLDSNIYDIHTCDIDQLDIAELNAVKQYLIDIQPDVIVNCAAYTAVDKCEEEVELAYKANAIGPRNLAIISNEIGARIVHVSTDYVFDGDGLKNVDGQLQPYTEFDRPNPQTVYGKTKLEGENFVRIHNPKHFIVRTAWLYGDGNNFVRTMVKLAGNHKELKVVADQIGSPTSTYELSKAIIALINTENYGLFHGTCEGQCSWYDFTKEIFKLKGIDTQVNPCTTEEFPRPAKRPAYSVIDNSMFRMTLDYRFGHWKDAIKKYIDEGEA